MPYVRKSAYLGKTEEARERQLSNLKQGQKKGLAKVRKDPKTDPFSSIYKNNIIGYLEDQFYIPETKAPVILESWQKEKIFTPLFELDPQTNLRKYSLGVIGLPKKNAKSTMAAMIANYFLFQDEELGEIILTANSRDQSSWVILDKLKKSLLMNYYQAKEVKILEDAIEVKKTRTVARIIAPNYRTASGSNPSLTIFDELWAFELEAARKFWDELTTVPTRKQPLTLVVSYAGYDQDSLLYELYRKGKERKDPKMFFLWEHRNLASWITEDYLKTQRRRLRGNTYLRLHENRWTSSESAFIDLEDWDRCIQRNHRPLLPDRSHYLFVGVDVGITHDSSAVVAVYKENDQIKLACHRCWTPSKDSPVDLEAVEDYIEGLARNYIVREVRYDPYQFQRSAMTLAKKGLKMVEFPQTQDRLTNMGQSLYDLIRGGNLVSYKDRLFREHAEKARAKETQRGWRIVKEKSSHRIDLVIALAMAVIAAIQAKVTTPGHMRVLFGKRRDEALDLSGLSSGGRASMMRPLIDRQKWRGA